MSDVADARPEILKLAKLLGTSPERLSYLEKVPAQDIRKLREQVTDLLFTANEATLRRLAAASRLLPVSLVAMIGQRAFGPVLAARITGLLDPSRALEMADTMPISFLADVAGEEDLWEEITDLVRHLRPEQRAALAQRARETGFYDRLGPVAEALGR